MTFLYEQLRAVLRPALLLDERPSCAVVDSRHELLRLRRDPDDSISLSLNDCFCPSRIRVDGKRHAAP